MSPLEGGCRHWCWTSIEQQVHVRCGNCHINEQSLSQKLQLAWVCVTLCCNLFSMKVFSSNRLRKEHSNIFKRLLIMPCNQSEQIAINYLNRFQFITTVFQWKLLSVAFNKSRICFRRICSIVLNTYICSFPTKFELYMQPIERA